MMLSISQIFRSLRRDKKLRRLLRRKIEKLRDDVLDGPKEEKQEPPFAIDKRTTEFQSLEELNKILQLREATRSRLTDDVSLVVSAAIVIGIIVGTLFYWPVGETEIELELEVSEVKFSLSKPMILVDTLRLSELGLFDVQEVRLPRSQFKEKQRLQFPPDAQSRGIKFSIVEKAHVAEENTDEQKEEKMAENAITLTSLFLPADSAVSLGVVEAPDKYRLKITAPEKDAIDLQFSLNGAINIQQSGPGGMNAQFEFLSGIRPNTVPIQPASRELTLDFTIAQQAGRRELVPLIRSRNFDFTRTEEFGPYSRTVSSLFSGELFLKEFEEKHYTFKYGDHVRIGDFDGLIRQATLGENHIALALHGMVGEIEAGPGTEKYSLMPSKFEQCQANHAFSLLWGASASLFGAVFIVLRWWTKAL